MSVESASDVVVLGGTGFIGRHYVEALRREGRRVRLLRRPGAASAAPAADGDHLVTTVTGDLDDTAALSRLITPGSTIVNLAWSGVTAPADAVRQTRGLAEVCRRSGARLLLHCSTASVYGGCGDRDRLDDRTPPRPADTYGHTKLAVDEALRAELEGRVPLIILRPTSVFGPGGQALLALGRALHGGHGVANYLRSSLFGRRLLHLVPMETVVAAFRFFETRAPRDTSCRCYLIAADDEPLNRFQALERHLMTLWGLPAPRWPRVPVPPAVLRLVLTGTGRGHALPFTVFDDVGLREIGFRPPVSFESALAAFASWFAAQKPAGGAGAHQA